jgi:phospholipase/lecithinase/hemolysin
MAFQWMRRVLLALAPAALLALAACGGGTIESQFTPTRMVVFGDALSDMGNTGSRFTVNGPTAQWVKLMALDYGVALEKSAAGGTDYATGNARVVLKPDAAGNNATPTVKEQVDAFLAANGSFNAGDLVVLSGGISDLIVQMQALRAGTISQDQFIANVKQAGRDLAAQARRIADAGASHIVVMGVPDLKATPWAVQIGQQALLSTASTDFNNALLVDLVNEGDRMLFMDTALLFNLMAADPGSYGMNNAKDIVCTSVDPGPGIGIGPNQVNSALCTTSTIVSGADPSLYLWADAIYPTPTAHSRLADYTFSRVHNRW